MAVKLRVKVLRILFFLGVPLPPCYPIINIAARTLTLSYSYSIRIIEHSLRISS